MRVFSYVALIGTIQSKAVNNEKGIPELPADFFGASEPPSAPPMDKAARKAAKKAAERSEPPLPERLNVKSQEAPTPVMMQQAPPQPMMQRAPQQMMQRAPPMPTLPTSYRPLFSDNSGFRAFAQKNNFPPLVEERKILQKTFQMNPRLKMGQYSALRPQDYRNTNYFNNMENNSQNNKNKQLECMVCNGRSYDECYRNGIARRCSEHEDACFLEVRYQGTAIVGVMSGCKQKVACINDMKQNFFDFNEYNQRGVNLLDHGKHDCQLYTGSKHGNSVCRNCCFEDFCTDGWQPQSFEDWNISKGTEVEKEMMLFDQFSRPPMYWDQMKSKQQISKMPRIQVINSLDEFNRPPTMADLVDADGKAPVIPNVPGGKKEKKVPEFLKRQAQMAAGYKLNRSTQRPSTTQSVSDDDFMNLVAKIDGNDNKSPKASVRTTTRRPVPKRPIGKSPKAPAKRPGGKGPWSHLPPWKQRQLQAARQKAMAKKQQQKQAAPAAMKFSEWQEHPGTQKATFEEGPVVEVETSLSDDEFSDLIASLDSKKNTDLEALVREIEIDLSADKVSNSDSNQLQADTNQH